MRRVSAFALKAVMITENTSNNTPATILQAWLGDNSKGLVMGRAEWSNKGNFLGIKTPLQMNGPIFRIA